MITSSSPSNVRQALRELRDEVSSPLAATEEQEHWQAQ